MESNRSTVCGAVALRLNPVTHGRPALYWLPVTVIRIQVGAAAGLYSATLMEVIDGPVEFVDTRGNKRTGKVHIKPTSVVADGVPYGRPCGAPFSPR